MDPWQSPTYVSLDKRAYTVLANAPVLHLHIDTHSLNLSLRPAHRRRCTVDL